MPDKQIYFDTISTQYLLNTNLDYQKNNNLQRKSWIE